MTMTRPCRRITLHLSQIFFTDGWTFTGDAAHSSDATLDLDGPVLLRHARHGLLTRFVSGPGFPGPVDAHAGTRRYALVDCRTGGADALARASRAARPQHDNRTARAPPATLPRSAA